MFYRTEISDKGIVPGRCCTSGADVGVVDQLNIKCRVVVR